MNFFNLALEEYGDSISETIRYNALSNRLAKLETKDFDKIMQEDEPKTPVVVDHEANLRQAQGN